MSSPETPDPSTARFRRGAGRPVGPPGPPPVVGGRSDALGPLDAGSREDGAVPAPPGPVLPPLGEGPITVADLPAPSTRHDPEAPGAPRLPEMGLYAEPAATPFGELLTPHEPSGDWLPVDDDPGRTSGIVSIVVGFFVGIVGVFIGIASIRSSRRVGLAGALGTAGVVVSALNLIVGGAVGLSWVRYEVSLSQQCALVGPGQYVTQSGDQVTCP